MFFLGVAFISCYSWAYTRTCCSSFVSLYVCPRPRCFFVLRFLVQVESMQQQQQQQLVAVAAEELTRSLTSQGKGNSISGSRYSDPTKYDVRSLGPTNSLLPWCRRSSTSNTNSILVLSRAHSRLMTTTRPVRRVKT